MSNLPESASYDVGIYELETADPVQGGVSGVSNNQAKGLANRTAYLKVHMDAAEAAIAALNTALATPPTTLAAGDEGDHYATTRFVHRAQGGNVTVDLTGGAPVTLTSDQWGCAVIILIGAITANINVIFPARGDQWVVVNRTTGAFAVTCKTASGTGVKVAQGRSKSIYGDGTNILTTETDLSTRPRTVSTATLLAAGDQVTVDFSGGIFALTLPAAPLDGDQVVVRGNFKVSALTILRNGKLIFDQDAIAQPLDYLVNRNNASVVMTYIVPGSGSAGWLVTQG